jgi:hypothetical protein
MLALEPFPLCLLSWCEAFFILDCSQLPWGVALPSKRQQVAWVLLQGTYLLDLIPFSVSAWCENLCENTP